MKRTGFNPKPSNWQRKPRQRKEATTTEGVVRLTCGALWPVEWQSEKDWQDMVEQYAHLNGWTYWHNNNPRMSDAGLPDLILFRDRIVWVELKVRDRKGRAGRVRPAQMAFYASIQKAGGEAYVFTWPDDWDQVKAVLGR